MVKEVEEEFRGGDRRTVCVIGVVVCSRADRCPHATPPAAALLIACVRASSFVPSRAFGKAVGAHAAFQGHTS